MNSTVLDGIVFALAVALIVIGVSMKWGIAWGFICWGALLLLRVVAPTLPLLIARRENRDA
jgi:hypothetical protein